VSFQDSGAGLNLASVYAARTIDRAVRGSKLPAAYYIVPEWRALWRVYRLYQAQQGAGEW